MNGNSQSGQRQSSPPRSGGPLAALPGDGRTPGACGKSRAQQGQALVLFAAMLPFFLAVIGLTIDAGTVFAARCQVQGIADTAARAGANELNVAVYRVQDGDAVVLDKFLARMVAEQYLVDQGVGPEGLGGAVHVTDEEIVVTVWRDVPLGFLQLVGRRTYAISATATAEPFVSVAGPP